jgi:hypothetical protein
MSTSMASDDLVGANVALTHAPLSSSPVEKSGTVCPDCVIELGAPLHATHSAEDQNAMAREEIIFEPSIPRAQ